MLTVGFYNTQHHSLPKNIQSCKKVYKTGEKFRKHCRKITYCISAGKCEQGIVKKTGKKLL